MSDNLGGSLGSSSLLLHSTQSSFDVQNESDVISLLKVIHQNSLDPDVKNHLRDLIFEYRYSQSNARLLSLHEIFSPLGVTIVVPEDQASIGTPVKIKVNAVVQKKPTLGIERPEPRFSSVQPKKHVVSPNTKSTVVAPPQQQIVEPAAKTQQAPVVPVEQSAKPAVSAIKTVLDTGKASERILEIKRVVNAKIGNPVNLIETHKEIGREYMNALLDAMKKVNGGQKQEVVAAMERLEKIFTKVEQILVTVGVQNAVTKQALPDEHKTIDPVLTVNDEVVQKTPTPVGREIETSPVVVKDVVSKIPTQQSAVSEPPKTVSVPDESRVQQTSVEATTHTAGDEAKMHSVAKEKQLQDLMHNTSQKEILTQKLQEDKKSATMDPLFTPKVTAGLEQLLSEWSLFKSSGIFGTGPSGKDHALYVQLAPLTMAAVIAGRFEGATPYIKQSITDYMNGWRYEDGIVHELGEDFEHYLRRVIKKILEKQNNK